MDVVKAAGWFGNGLMVMAKVLALLIPQPFVAVTDNVPLVAKAEKETVTELVVPVMVAPDPL